MPIHGLTLGFSGVCLAASPLFLLESTSSVTPGQAKAITPKAKKADKAEADAEAASTEA